MGSGLLFVLGGGIPYSKGNVNMERALSKYNHSKLNSTSQLQFGMGQNGIGLRYSF